MASITITEDRITFTNDSGVVGELSWNYGALMFNGQAEHAAFLFFDNVMGGFNKHAKILKAIEQQPPELAVKTIKTILIPKAAR